VPPGSAVLQKAGAPLLDMAVDAFGPDRCMFESNVPVRKHSFTYVSMWNAYTNHIRGYQPTERTALLSGTPARVYRIEMP
jgi:predicted TIM-barrel fold metal-dependent hydrolase